MRAVWALVRASWLTAASYRLSLVLSILQLLVVAAPLYFLGHELQPLMADAIRPEAPGYFGFLLIGLITFGFLPVAVQTLPSTLNASIGSGTLETLLGTPARIPTILVGLTGYSFLWTSIRSLVLLAVGVLLGATVQWARLPAAVLILALIILAHAALGLFGAAMIMAFRTTGPILQGVLVLSALLGGVYYPTRVIPSWLEPLSSLFPVTYGLRALRRVLLNGVPLSAVMPDIGVLSVMTMGLLGSGAIAFAMALQYGRRHGTLGHY